MLSVYKVLWNVLPTASTEFRILQKKLK